MQCRVGETRGVLHCGVSVIILRFLLEKQNIEEKVWELEVKEL